MKFIQYILIYLYYTYILADFFGIGNSIYYCEEVNPHVLVSLFMSPDYISMGFKKQVLI